MRRKTRERKEAVPTQTSPRMVVWGRLGVSDVEVRERLGLVEVCVAEGKGRVRTRLEANHAGPTRRGVTATSRARGGTAPVISAFGILARQARASCANIAYSLSTLLAHERYPQ
jgi:hypothetical protein